ncbi:MAG: DUF2892 domain-containing protein [Gaiellaceae bacterium]
MTACARSGRLERVLFALAGSITLASVLLALTVSPWFLAAAVFAALNQWLYALAGECPASLILRRLGVAAGSDA